MPGTIPLPLPRPPAHSTPARPSFEGLRAWFRSHPILCLLLLTPGIPEYLSGSSPLAVLVLNPVAFALFLGLNLALYGPGVLLIREAAIRWGKGWATILTLGAAYAILEEGVALNTFFFPRAAPVGSLGFYGHWLGVSWVWVTGLIMVHAVFSIGLPILLHGLALPETGGKSLLTRRGVTLAFVVLAADVVGLGILTRKIYSFDPGWPILVGSLIAIGLLAYAAFRMPASLLAPRETGVPAPRGLLFLFGVLLLSGTFLLEGIFQSARAAPALCILAVIAMYALLTFASRHVFGSGSNPRGAIAFAAGALVPIMLVGVFSSLRLPVALVADLAAIVFLVHLWMKYADPPSDRVLAPVNAVPWTPAIGSGPCIDSPSTAPIRLVRAP
ncbi:MAG: hypothetical protein L3J93_05410 [Thermoplasmata archaeon]|nr:hypothetical protein [Thermoplasmata archaeon]